MSSDDGTNDARNELTTVEIVQALIDQHAHVDRDIVPIDTSTWAIHGLIAVDGEVIMAEFTEHERSGSRGRTALRGRERHRDSTALLIRARALFLRSPRRPRHRRTAGGRR